VGERAKQNGASAEAETFTLPQLAESSGVDYRTLHNWQKRGLLSPSHQLANGSGTTNLFGLEDALQILVLAELRRAGVEMRVLQGAASELREIIAHLDEDTVLVIGEDIKLLADTRELDSSLADSGPVLVYRPTRAREALRSLQSASQAA
jgi:DNA-binding transcriptional MerR regulator